MFQWMEILAPGLVAQAVLALSIVAAVGLALGSIGFRGIRLGAAGVLFAGIFFGQLGMHLDERILEFVRDFGLILFVYTIGLQVGPSFFPSLRRQGLELNVLAAVIVLLGGLIAACLRVVFRLSIPAVAGIFSGATTNTPSLAAAQAVLQGFKGQSSDNTDLLPTSDRIRCGLPVGNDSPGIRRPDSYFDPSLTPQKSRALRSGAHIAD
jgi:putative transport protein